MVGLLAWLSDPAEAIVYSNIAGNSVDFPAGAVSFADELVDFQPGLVFDPDRGTETPLPAYRDGNNTLGPPDVDLQKSIACATAPDTTSCRFVSLGRGGSLVVRFTDNLLTGSGDTAPDLWIFEAGPPDITFVDISSDGTSWLPLGEFSSFLQGIDIDAAGYGPDSRFAYVRLRDNPDVGQSQGATLGADIDAIGAISTVVVPLPGAFWLLLGALLACRAPAVVSRRPRMR